jgi:hypothetical protein
MKVREGHSSKNLYVEESERRAFHLNLQVDKK